MGLKLKQVYFMYAKDNTVSYNLITNNQDHLRPFYFLVWLYKHLTRNKHDWKIIIFGKQNSTFWVKFFF